VLGPSVPRTPRHFPGWISPALALLVVAAVYFHRLDRPLLWEDETYTGIQARNLLHHGFPTAYDGRNVLLYQNGAQLNRDLVPEEAPWAQYYLGAASLVLCGDDTAGLRVLFVLTGLLAFFPVRAVLRSRVRYPDCIAALALLAPQIVLFQRNARYYPLLIFLYAALVWHVCADFRSARVRFVLAVAILTLLFHTHPFAAVCCGAALALFCVCFRRAALGGYLAATGIGLLSWLAWGELLGPTLGRTPRFFTDVGTHFGWWLGSFLAGLKSTATDLDVVGCLPALLWLAALALLLGRNRRALGALGRDPLPAFVLMTLAVQTVAGAALFGYEGEAHYAVLRYMPHLLVFALVLLFLALDAAVRPGWLFLLVCLAGVACNLGSLSYWVTPAQRSVPASWLAPVYAEILHPPPGPWDGVLARLRSDPVLSPARDQAVMAMLPTAQGTLIFYVGDLYAVRPGWELPPEACGEAMLRVMGDAACRRIYAQPEWIVNVGLAGFAGDGYVTAALAPSDRHRPVDGGRPELTRHSFPRPGTGDGLTLLRRAD